MARCWFYNKALIFWFHTSIPLVILLAYNGTIAIWLYIHSPHTPSPLHTPLSPFIHSILSDLRPPFIIRNIITTTTATTSITSIHTTAFVFVFFLWFRLLWSKKTSNIVNQYRTSLFGTVLFFSSFSLTTFYFCVLSLHFFGGRLLILRARLHLSIYFYYILVSVIVLVCCSIIVIDYFVSFYALYYYWQQINQPKKRHLASLALLMVYIGPSFVFLWFIAHFTCLNP